MDLKTEKIISYLAAVILFLVGVVCYAAFPDEKPEDPVRIMLKSSAGKILFTHKVHTLEDGYGLECVDCHHVYEQEEGTKPEACGECHEVESEDKDVPKRSDAFHQQCIGCHEEDGTGPVECASCHVL